MGCVFNFTKLKAKSKEEAVREGKAIIEQAAWDYGHAGYTGSFAEAHDVEVCTHVVASPAEAETWLDEHAEKWEAALLIADVNGNWYMGANCSS